MADLIEYLWILALPAMLIFIVGLGHLWNLATRRDPGKN